MMGESPYIRWVKNKRPEPDPQYIHELDVLRAMVRQENRQGDVGWGGSWTKERYHSLKEKHPEAATAFEAELRWEREEEEHHRKEILDQCGYSPYIAEVEGWPDSEAKDSYLSDLKRLRDVMIRSTKVGYGSYPMGLAMANLSNRYPHAHEFFEEELIIRRSIYGI